MSSTLDLDHRTPSNSDNDDEKGGSFVTPDQNQGGDCVKEPTENDVLCGRGGSINSHPGNERFRTLVEKRKRIYLTARFKREKRLIASSIVSEIRALNPPGRFLSRDAKSGKWKDIGDEKARDKTSQALRENAPSIRAEIETEINEQRAEMQRAEEEEAAARVPPTQAPYPPYNQGWGYPGYYSYPHNSMAPPPPPPPHHHGYPPPPPPMPAPHHGYPPSHYESSHAPPWGHQQPPPHYHPGAPPGSSSQKSFLDVTADSIRSWIPKTSLSFGGVNGSSSHDLDNTDNNSRSSISSRPIVYVHDNDNKKRRMVKFRDDSKHSRQRCGSVRPVYSHDNATNSLVDGLDDQECDEIEPHNAHDEANMPLMTQISNQILTSIGSWDASALCGQDNSDERIPFPRSSHLDDGHEYVQDEDMAVEWEGQEVQLVDQTEDPCPPSPVRMPPPRSNPDRTTSIGLSSLGSCHSWLPDQFGNAASFFRGDNSLDMDLHSAGGGTENFSLGGSLGGNSLTRVFENEALEEPFPNMNHRSLSQMPSWERSVRSRSPLSIGSDDESLISKSSSKISDSGLSPLNADDQGMLWETRE